ncbi:hypothetical protein FB451DRAFT_1572496 [Mycena latifolia]|nr:hypothetical protein FB451DRAFT_1572496 [Mycena latifolia]
MGPTAPLDTLNKVIGALMLGTFANSMLYMLEILELIKYFKTFRNDSATIKTCIVILALLDTTCTFAEWACIYLYGVLHWGDLDYLAYQNLVIPIYIYTRFRDHWVHRPKFLDFPVLQIDEATLICAGLVVMAGASLVGSVWCATQLSIVTDYDHRSVAVKSAILWLVSSAATDISIAAALVLQLQGTGSLTTAIAICVLATYLTDTSANICVGFGFMLGRLYTLTMLFNLNNRKILKEGGQSSGRDNTPMGADISLQGITIHRTAIVHIDEEQAPSRHEMDDKRSPAYGSFTDYDKANTEGTDMKS